ncbi:MAG: hypothetical protein IPG04_35010 [Polyangiaceae bacterium]|jgi:hypothetical protein|nr:hypothetical protein [Polyangiaceae bacterium]
MTEERKSPRERHVAWAKERLSSEWGKAQLRKNLQAGFEAVLAAPVGELFEVEALAKLADHLASDGVVSKTTRPIVRTFFMLEMARLREDPSKLEQYVSPEARALFEELLERPDLISPKFVRELLGHPAFEPIMRDVLDDALREFSEKVDPFKAEWGLPSVMKIAGPLAFGLGAFAKALDAVREEFQKRLEPERKRFLQGFAKRGLKTVAEQAIKRSSDPQFIALRKELFAWLLEQPVSELTAPMTQATTELSERLGHELTRHNLGLEATKRRRRANIEMMVRAHAKQPLRQALATYGANLAPDFDAIVEVLWPLMRPALRSPEIEGFVEGLVGEFYDV